MQAFATKIEDYEDEVELSCLTCSYAGFCNGLTKANIKNGRSCLTCSYAGFCNAVRKFKNANDKELSYLLICRLLQLVPWILSGF